MKRAFWLFFGIASLAIFPSASVHAAVTVPPTGSQCSSAVQQAIQDAQGIETPASALLPQITDQSVVSSLGTAIQDLQQAIGDLAMRAGCGTNPVPPPQPPVGSVSASLSANGVNALSLSPGAAVAYHWASQGGSKFNSSLAIYNSSGAAISADPCNNKAASSWIIASASGTILGATAQCQVGYDYVITYHVADSSGATAAASVNIAVTASSSSTGGAIASISGVQGYDSATKTYTAGTALLNSYLIVYGTFDVSGNFVLIDGQPAQPDYQGAGQINIPLSGIPLGSHSVAVVTNFGTTAPKSFTVTSPTQFPATVLVTAASLNVRSAPNSTAPLAGSQVMHAGNIFTAINEVQGGNVNGDNLWWKSSLGDYIWSGGTSVASSSPANQPPATSSINSATLIGPYFWGGSVSGASSGNIMSKGIQLTNSLGAKVVRILMGPNSDIDYYGGSCIPNFSLKSLAQRSDFNAILNDSQFTAVIITAYDGISFGDCTTKSYLDPNFYNATNTQKIEGEYTDFANYLKQFNKTFIIDNWESDNDAYCGSAYQASLTSGASCPGATQNLAGLTKWFQARHAGIAAAGAQNVSDAIEFNSVNMLSSKNLPSVLYNVIPKENAAYYSYSSYESINVSPDQLATDINTIRGALHGGALFIGEAGLPVGVFGNATQTAQRLQQTLTVAQQKNVPYVIIWNLLDSPHGFGLFGSSGSITNSGMVIKSLIGNVQ